MSRQFKRALRSILTASVAAACLGAEAAPVSAWGWTNLQGGTNASWAFSDVFTVGVNRITVTSLGALDIGRDGFVTADGIAVGLYRESDHALLASAQVRSSDALVGNYRFADIADIVLEAATRYRVVGITGNDPYNNYQFANPHAVDPRITSNGYNFCLASAILFCNASVRSALDPQASFANFQLDNLSAAPEPGALSLVALAGLALAATRRRRPA